MAQQRLPGGSSPSSSSQLASTSTPSWPAKLAEAQALGNSAIQLEFAGDYSRAFESYVRAGELYVWLVRNAGPEQSQAMREKLKATGAKVLQRADKIKRAKGNEVRPVQELLLSPERQSNVLADSASINGVHLPLWTEADALGPRVQALPNPELSSKQRSQGARFRDILAGAPSEAVRAKLIEVERPLRGADIVQDAVTDCSFVAALQVAAEHDHRWGTKLAHGPLFPKDDRGYPKLTRDQRSSVRMLINGAHRCISIDSAIPCYEDGAPLCAAGYTDHQGSTSAQLWPGLLEKAYLLAHGGYDFKGSNASYDLHALTGWIPETVGLQAGEFRREGTWHRVYEAWTRGEVLITLGTGIQTRGTLKAGRLIPGHNYAVLDMAVDESGERKLVVSNPWTARRHDQATAPGRPDAMARAFEDNLSLNGAPVASGSFALSWEDVCSHFHTLYLNWDPSSFAHSFSAHFRLKARAAAHSKGSSQAGAAEEARFRLTLSDLGGDDAHRSTGLAQAGKEELLVHLVQHLRSKDTKTEFVALRVVEQPKGSTAFTNGIRDDNKARTYTDGAHQLVPVRLRPGQRSFQIIVSRHSASDPASFSLYVYSGRPLSIEEITRTLAFEQTIEGSWTGRSAGGNITFPTFVHNPQWAVAIARDGTQLALTLETDQHIPAQLLLTWHKGQRVENCDEAEVVTSSGPYSYGLATASSSDSGQAGLKAGVYTLVASAFEPTYHGAFTLRLESSEAIGIKSIPAEGSGMFARRLQGSWDGENARAGSPSAIAATARQSIMELRFSFRLTKGGSRIMARVTDTAPPGKARRAIRLVVISKGGQMVASSGPLSDLPCGAALPEVRLVPGAYELGIQSVGSSSTSTAIGKLPTSPSPASRPGFILAFYSDEAVELR